jgi:hypothetical protein
MGILDNMVRAKAAKQRLVPVTYSEKPDVLVEIERLGLELDLSKSEMFRAVMREGLISVLSRPLIEEIEAKQDLIDEGHTDLEGVQQLQDEISALKSQMRGLKERWEL